MSFVSIAILVLLAVLVAALVLARLSSRPGRTAPVRPPPAAATKSERVRSPLAAARPPSASLEARARAARIPPALADFQLVPHQALDEGRKQALVAALGRIPRPPSSLQLLVSPEFMAKASSAELSAVVMRDPLLAAKVLASVNSPFYGLDQPVSSMGQAITFLGFNTVRSIGLKYLMSDAFKAGNPELGRVFDTIWAASAMAGELCARMAQKLGLPDHGTLVTHLMLSFIGQLATCSLMPPGLAVAVARRGFFERVQTEQAQLGLGSADIGSLLLHAWGLPSSIIDDVHGIGAVLVTPAEAVDGQRGARLALCFLCARLGERLAQGSLDDLAAFDPATSLECEFFHLRSYLAAPGLARLTEFLHAPETLAFVAQRKGAAPAHA